MKNRNTRDSIMKFFIVFTILLTSLFTGSAQASSDIDVGLIVSQFSAEVIAPSSFVATAPDGAKTTLEKGKYFIAVNQGKIKIGNSEFASGTGLEIAEEVDADKPSAARPHSLFTINRQEYRGTLKIYITNDGKNLTKLYFLSKLNITNDYIKNCYDFLVNYCEKDMSKVFERGISEKTFFDKHSNI